MAESVNVYKKLNKREKYILETLGIKMQDKPLTSAEVNSIISSIINLRERISVLPITSDQFDSAYYALGKSYKKYFPDEESIVQAQLYNNWPTKKINVLSTLSKDNIETINILGFKFDDKEIDAKEFMEVYSEIISCLLKKFGTGIKMSECNKLVDKIYKTFHSKLTVSDLISNANID